MERQFFHETTLTLSIEDIFHNASASSLKGTHVSARKHSIHFLWNLSQKAVLFSFSTVSENSITMITFSPSVLFSILLILLPSYASSFDLSILGVSSDLLGSSGDDASSNGLSPYSPPTPNQCWMDAIKILQPQSLKQVDKGSNMCEHMDPTHQKALAFELSRCHLADLGRKMTETVTGKIDDPDRDCTATYDDDGIFPNLSHCLNALTEAGTQAYTTFFANIVAYCNHLTTHLAIAFQQQTALELTKITHQTVNHFTSIIESQQASFQEREKEYRQQHQEFFAAMEKRQESLKENEASLFEAFQAWTSKFKKQESEQKEFFTTLTKVWEDQAAKMEEHYEKKLLSASSFFQPILTIETWLNLAKLGYRLLAITLHFLLIALLILLATRPERCRRVRTIMLSLIMMETLGEVCVHFLMNDLVADEQKKEMIAALRPTTLCVEGLIYAVNLVFSCCCCFDWAWFGSGAQEDEYDDDLDEDELAVNHAQREEMRSEFHLLMAETESNKADPTATLPLPTATTSTTSHNHMPFRPPQLPTPETSSDDEPRGVPQPSFVPTSPPFAKPETSSTLVASSAEAAPAATHTPVAGTPPKVSGTQATDQGEKMTTSASEFTASIVVTGVTVSTPKTLSPVTGLIQDAAATGQGQKKRAPEEINPIDESDSDDRVDISASSCASSSPNKRRRVEVLESTAATNAEDEYHTAAEEEEDEDEDEEDSAAMVEDEDESEEKEDETKAMVVENEDESEGEEDEAKAMVVEDEGKSDGKEDETKAMDEL